MEEGKKDREACEGLGLGGGAPEAGLWARLLNGLGRLTFFF
jgi:hypothetical protein